MPENTLKLGIIGGALDSAIGRSHHIASQMDGRFRIVAGCFSLNSKMNEDTAALLDVPADRLYSEWHTFLKSEQGKLDAVLLLTPTPMHAEMAAEALAAGFYLISEKALSVSSAEAAAIRVARDQNNGFVAVTYNYTGYPIIRELRHMIESGKLGQITHVAAEMPQEGFLRLVGAQDTKPQPQAWRLKDDFIPTVSLDLGVHVHHLIHFLTQASPIEVCAMEQQQGHFDGIIDNIQCLARYSGDLPVQLWYGKTALGHANGLRIRVFGTTASAEWVQMNPEYLTLHDNRGHTSLITRAANGLHICNQERYTRFKAGHPAGFMEAFANYYADLADWLIRHRSGDRQPHPMVAGVEIAEEGLRMMEAIARSARTRSWQPVPSQE
jgi:predicted dehydrogenase